MLIIAGIVARGGGILRALCGHRGACGPAVSAVSIGAVLTLRMGVTEKSGKGGKLLPP